MSVEFPDNDFTRMIEMTASANRTGVRGAGVATAAPLPTAQSADLGREVPPTQAVAAPLPPEEKARLDALAREAGVKDESLGNTEETGQDNYGTLEDAIAAGRSVVTPTVQAVTAREVLAARPVQRVSPFVTPQPRMPNFENVEGIDLTLGVVVVDGLTFPISKAKAKELRRFVLETARAAILNNISQAKAPRRARGRKQAVQPVQSGEGTSGVQPAPRP